MPSGRPSEATRARRQAEREARILAALPSSINRMQRSVRIGWWALREILDSLVARGVVIREDGPVMDVRPGRRGTAPQWIFRRATGVKVPVVPAKQAKAAPKGASVAGKPYRVGWWSGHRLMSIRDMGNYERE